MTSSSVPQQANASQHSPSATVILTAAITPTNATAVSDVSYFIQLLFVCGSSVQFSLFFKWRIDKTQSYIKYA